MNWFWNTLWKWFGDHKDEKPPPIPPGKRRDTRPPRADAGQDIRMKHENIKGADDD